MAKTVHQGLVSESFELPGASIKEIRAKNLIKPYTQGLTSKNKVQGWRVLFLGKTGAKTEKKGPFAIIFELDWTEG